MRIAAQLDRGADLVDRGAGLAAAPRALEIGGRADLEPAALECSEAEAVVRRDEGKGRVAARDGNVDHRGELQLVRPGIIGGELGAERDTVAARRLGLVILRMRGQGDGEQGREREETDHHARTSLHASLLQARYDYWLTGTQGLTPRQAPAASPRLAKGPTSTLVRVPAFT